MIARVWRGESTPELASRYVQHLERSVLPELRKIEGHHHAYLLQRSTVGRVSFLVVTVWESMEAVRAFAGDNAEIAVVEAAARAVLTAFDKTVDHYDVILDRPA